MLVICGFGDRQSVKQQVESGSPSGGFLSPGFTTSTNHGDRSATAFAPILHRQRGGRRERSQLRGSISHGVVDEQIEHQQQILFAMLLVFTEN